MPCPATRRTAGRRRLPRRWPRHVASLALPADDRARRRASPAWSRRHEFEPLDADAAAALYELTDAMTSAAGMPAYEISNHARPGHESRHNLTYWRYGDYAGVGPGAHGRRLGMRTVRHPKPENFLSAVARNGHGIAEESLAVADRSRRRGVGHGPATRRGHRCRVRSPSASAWARSSTGRRVDRLVASGHLARDGAVIATTAKGRLLLDRILGEIALPEPRASAAEAQTPESVQACAAGVA